MYAVIIFYLPLFTSACRCCIKSKEMYQISINLQCHIDRWGVGQPSGHVVNSPKRKLHQNAGDYVSLFLSCPLGILQIPYCFQTCTCTHVNIKSIRKDPVHVF